MIIIYTSNTGNTKEYAMMLRDAFDLPAYRLGEAPAQVDGAEAIYLGWIMAGGLVGYAPAAKKYHVVCAVGVGMSPESEEQTKILREKIKAPENLPVFYLQGGYDKKKLKGFNKAVMNVVEKTIMKRLEGLPEEKRAEEPVYKMITEGYSVVSKERLQPVIDWYENR
jgi:hypothetical protein